MRGQITLPQTIALFQENYPNIRVELAEGSNGELHQMLLRGSIDLAIAEFPEVLLYIPRELISCHGQTDHPLW